MGSWCLVFSNDGFRGFGSTHVDKHSAEGRVGGSGSAGKRSAKEGDQWSNGAVKGLMKRKADLPLLEQMTIYINGAWL